MMQKGGMYWIHCAEAQSGSTYSLRAGIKLLDVELDLHGMDSCMCDTYRPVGIENHSIAGDELLYHCTYIIIYSVYNSIICNLIYTQVVT